MALVLTDEELRNLSKSGKLVSGKAPSPGKPQTTVEKELQHLSELLAKSHKELVTVLGGIKPEVVVNTPEPPEKEERPRRWRFTVVRRDTNHMIQEILAEAEE